MSIHIQVESDVIANAVQKESRHCMIADAIHKKYPHYTHIQVDVQSIRFTNPRTNLRYIYLTPPEAQKQILRFDAGKKIEPFSVSLNDVIIKDAKKKARSSAHHEHPGSKAAQHVQQTLSNWLKQFDENKPIVIPKSETSAPAASPIKKKARKKGKSNYRFTKTLPASQREYGLRKLVGKKIDLHV